MKEPKDLEVKIGTKTEAEWTTMMKLQEGNIITMTVNLAIAKEVLELCKEKIKEEKNKAFK